MPDGYEVVEASLPALVSVSNELGQPAIPHCAALWRPPGSAQLSGSVADLDLDAAQLEPRITLHDLFVPVSNTECEIIEGDDDADAGRKLALRLREDKFI